MNTKSQSLFIRELHKDDKVNGLSLGSQEYTPLKSFLKNAALDFHLNNIAKTYVIINQEKPARVYGYLSLMCSEIVINNLQRPQGNKNAKRYDTFPAVKLARLAVDKSLQGQGYGLLLVNTATAIVKDFIMPNIGCRFLTVDSKPQAISFYERAGFTLLDTEDNKKNPNPLMLLDLHTIN